MVKNRKTVFLDRDGTINREVNYLDKIEDFQPLPGVIEALKLLTENQWQIICVTNQSGVARGYITEDFLTKLHNHIIKKFKKEGVDLKAIYYCPHHEEGVIPEYKVKCRCRKPGIGLIEKATKDFPVDMRRSIMVGDKLTDILTGKNAGIKSAMVMTGYGEAEYARGKDKGILPDYRFEDLLEFASWLVKNEKAIFTDGD